MSHKDRDRYALGDWREAGPSVATVRLVGWIVTAVCRSLFEVGEGVRAR
jgi:hypothetical protein